MSREDISPPPIISVGDSLGSHPNESGKRRFLREEVFVLFLKLSYYVFCMTGPFLKALKRRNLPLHPYP